LKRCCMGPDLSRRGVDLLVDFPPISPPSPISVRYSFLILTAPRRRWPPPWRCPSVFLTWCAGAFSYDFRITFFDRVMPISPSFLNAFVRLPLCPKDTMNVFRLTRSRKFVGETLPPFLFSRFPSTPPRKSDRDWNLFFLFTLRLFC